MSNDETMTRAAIAYLNIPELRRRDEDIAWKTRLAGDVGEARYNAFMAGWKAAMQHVRERDIKAMTE